MSVYSDIVLADSPSGYWRLGEASGDAADSSGNGHTMVWGSSVTHGQAGALINDADKAASFPGGATNANARLSLTSTAFDYSGTVSCSFESWIYIVGTDATARRIFDHTPVSQGYECQITSTSLIFSRGGVGGLDLVSYATASIAAGWHHLVCTYDGTNMRMYLDGALVGGPTASSRSINALGSSEFTIGNLAAGSRTFNGYLDEVAIYPTALSAARVLAHYQAGISITLGASAAVASATLTVTAATQLPLGTSAGVSVTTLTLTAQTQVPLGTSAAVATTSLVVTGPLIAGVCAYFAADMARVGPNLGVTTVRMDASNALACITEIQSAGLQVLYIADYCADAYNGSAGDSKVPPLDAQIQNWADQQMTDALTLGPNLLAIEVWNEPWSNNFMHPHPDPVKYMKMVRAMKVAATNQGFTGPILAQCDIYQSSIVNAAGSTTSPAGGASDGGAAGTYILWVEQVIAQDTTFILRDDPQIQASQHNYSSGSPQSGSSATTNNRSLTDTESFNRYVYLWNRLASYGKTGHKIWVTEFGWSSAAGANWATYSADAFTVAAASGKVAAAFIFYAATRSDQNNPQNLFDYLTGAALQPVDGAIKTAVQNLAGAGGITLAASAAVSATTLSLAAQTQVPLVAAAAVSTTSLAVTAQTTVSLGTSAAVAAPTLALTAATQIPLGSSAATAAGTVALTAQTQVPLGTAAAVSATTLAVTAQTQIPLAASSAVAAATLTLTAQTSLPLDASTAVSTTTLTLTAQTTVALSSSDAQAAASLSLTAATTAALGAATGTSTGTLTVTAATQVPLNPAAAVSAATLDLTIASAAATIPLDPAIGVTAAALTVSAATTVALGGATATSTTTVALTAPTKVTASVAAGHTSATLTLTARCLIPLSTSTAGATAALAVTVTTSVPFAAAHAISTATIHVTAESISAAMPHRTRQTSNNGRTRTGTANGRTLVTTEPLTP